MQLRCLFLYCVIGEKNIVFEDDHGDDDDDDIYCSGHFFIKVYYCVPFPD